MTWWVTYLHEHELTLANWWIWLDSRSSKNMHSVHLMWDKSRSSPVNIVTVINIINIIKCKYMRRYMRRCLQKNLLSVSSTLSVCPIHWLRHLILTCCLYWLATDTLPVRPAARKSSLTPTSVSEPTYLTQLGRQKRGCGLADPLSPLAFLSRCRPRWHGNLSGAGNTVVDWQIGCTEQNTHTQNKKKKNTSACTSHCAHQMRRCEGEPRPDLWTPTQTFPLLLRHVSRHDCRDCATFLLLFLFRRKNGITATLTHIERLMLNQGGMRMSGSGGGGAREGEPCTLTH